MERTKITIIGAGVVGLAIAAELSGEYSDIVVLEMHDSFGRETSSRNSEVIHSGLYYVPGSLKARLCVEGRERLYHYCTTNAISYAKPGKLIVALDRSELDQLKRLYENGVQNNVDGLRILEKREIKKSEPRVNAEAAIHSAATGIINSHALMAHLYKVASSEGVIFSFGSEVNFIEPAADGYVIGMGREDYRFFSEVVINAAGLYSDRIAALAGIDVDAVGYRLRFCKGSYFYYAKRSPVNMLIYPLPHSDLKGLGVHATLDLSGRLRFGPDVEDIDSIDYKVNPDKRDIFFEQAKGFIEGLDKEAFLPDMSGIRPKLKGNGWRDFIIRHESDTGLRGLVNLIGIESPGLTACLSIATYVKSLIAADYPSNCNL